MENIGWTSVNERLPEEGKMVLIRTENQPIVKYAIASWEPDAGCFVDYDDYSFEATHWMNLTDPLNV